jgi:hypothetical protein
MRLSEMWDRWSSRFVAKSPRTPGARSAWGKFLQLTNCMSSTGHESAKPFGCFCQLEHWTRWKSNYSAWVSIPRTDGSEAAKNLGSSASNLGCLHTKALSPIPIRVHIPLFLRKLHLIESLSSCSRCFRCLHLPNTLFPTCSEETHN